MFAATGLLKQIRCPLGGDCSLTNCLFSHDARHDNQVGSHESTSQRSATSTQEDRSRPEPSAKRRKIEINEDVEPQARTELAKPNVSRSSYGSSNGLLANMPKRDSTPLKGLAQGPKDTSLQSTVRPVSPPTNPSARNQPAAIKERPANEKAEALNPRLIPNDPAGHNKRMVYLTAMHKELQRLNAIISKHEDKQVKCLQLSEEEITKIALDEEEKLAREQPTVYANVIKLQIVKYRRMTESEWIEVRRKSDDARKPKQKTEKPVITGLSPSEEVMMLGRMVTDQEVLRQWDYVITPPTEKEIESARLGVQAADGYENCDRCGSRFQVFPDRREDGTLTSGGKCIHHWGRPVYPKRQKTDAQVGQQEPRYSCCNELLGTKGCSEAPTHVFKITDPKRLAAVLPFEETGAIAKDLACQAVCFDCEMGYTVHGLELIRVTAVSWPEGQALLDVLVKPVGAILDLNSRFSGVFPEHMAKANEFDFAAWKKRIQSIQYDGIETDPEDPSRDLGIVSSPAVARELLMCLLDHNTLLVGHALENDLNAIRLIHPQIVDTVFLYPHPKGLPFRFGLRQLALQYLERHIQTAGAAGHSSLEDARATGDVARWKVKTEWDKLRRDGWTVRDGGFYAPGEGGSDAPPSMLPQIQTSSQSRKRKRQELQTEGTATGTDDTGDPSSDHRVGN